MSTCSKSFNPRCSIVLLLSLVVLLSVSGQVQAEDGEPILHVFVGDTTGPAGEQNSVITVFVDNWTDTVAAFEMWLMLDRIDIMEFQSGPIMKIDTMYWICTGGTYPECTDSIAGHGDTLYFKCLETDSLPPYGCIDSVRVMGHEDPEMIWPPEYDYVNYDTSYPVIGNIDTVGCLIGGWEQVVTRTFTGEANDMKITARANANFADGHNTTGIPSGQQGGVLFRMLGDIKDVPDTATERTAKIIALSSPADNFVFSRPNGTTIGLAYNQIMDTNMFWCETWDPYDPEKCALWKKVSRPPYDSLYIVPDSTPYVDSFWVDSLFNPHGTVWIEHGSITVDPPSTAICGNTNMSEDEKITLSDITLLVDHVYISKNPLEEACTGNTNCSIDMKITLSDITTLINHVYISKDPLCGCCSM